MANEVVIADTYYNRTTATGYDYRGFQANLVKAQTGEIAGAMRENSNREIAAAVASAALAYESVRRMQTGITTAIDKQTEVARAGFDSMNNTLEAGFGRVTNQLGRMSAEMNLGFARTEDAIARLSAEIRGRLDKIAQILETPRGTAARELYNNAFINYRKGFYEEALPDVQKAVEMLTTDYLSWFLEGEIYAFGAGEFGNVVDLDKSIAAYTNAAKYISPDAEKSEDAKRLAAEIRFYLGLAQYAKSNELFRAGNQAESGALLSAARDSFTRSYQYSGLMLEARYNAARCRALLGDASGALADLEAVINEDALYCVKAEIESDFDVIRGDYRRLIEKMRDGLYEKAAPVYKEITGAYELAKKEGLTQYFEKTVQIAQDVPADFETIPLFEQRVSAGLDKSLPYLDMRERISPYPALVNILKKGAEAVFQTAANDDGGVTIIKYAGKDTRVVIPASIGGKPVTAIGEKAFEQKQLTSVMIPGSVTTIGDGAFSGNQLTDVTIPGSVTTIGDGAFSRNQLTDVVIPDSVTWLSGFDNNKLSSVTIPGSVTMLSGFDNNNLSSVVIPNSVTAIGNYAFFGNRLSSVTIPGSVTTIGKHAFSGNQLTDVTIGKGVISIGDNAFQFERLFGLTYGSSKNRLESVALPDSVTTVGNNVFDGQNIQKISIGANVNIGEWRFSNGTKTFFASSYNEQGRKAGMYVPKDLSRGKWARYARDTRTAEKKQKDKRRGDRWTTIGVLLGFVLFIGGIALGIYAGHPFMLGIMGGIAGLVVAFASLARGWGILALALIGGGIALGIHLEHPFIGGIIAVIAGLVVWGVGISKGE